MIMSLVLFENEFLNIVAISFTALVLNELIMVALEITTWWVVVRTRKCRTLTFTRHRHVYMVVSEIVTFFLYAISLTFLPEYFGEYQLLLCFIVVCLNDFLCRSHIRAFCTVRMEGGCHGRD